MKRLLARPPPTVRTSWAPAWRRRGGFCTSGKPGAPPGTSLMSLPCVCVTNPVFNLGALQKVLIAPHFSSEPATKGLHVNPGEHFLQPLRLPEGSQQSNCDGGGRHGQCHHCQKVISMLLLQRGTRQGIDKGNYKTQTQRSLAERILSFLQHKSFWVWGEKTG